MVFEVSIRMKTSFGREFSRTAILLSINFRSGFSRVLVVNSYSYPHPPPISEVLYPPMFNIIKTFMQFCTSLHKHVTIDVDMLPVKRITE